MDHREGRAPHARLACLEKAGATVLRLPETAGRVDPRAALRALGRMGVVRLLAEGGGEVLGSLFERGLVDEVAFFLAPKVLGGAGAKRAVAGTGFRRWRHGPAIAGLELTRVGPDLLARGRVVR